MKAYKLLLTREDIRKRGLEPEYRFKRMKRSHAAYQPFTRRIYVNPDIDREQPQTIVYILTHEYIHWWVHINVGRRACFKLDKIGHRPHFPMTETEPVLLPVKWGGRHHRSMWNLVWTFIVLNNWKGT